MKKWILVSLFVSLVSFAKAQDTVLSKIYTLTGTNDVAFSFTNLSGSAVSVDSIMITWTRVPETGVLDLRVTKDGSTYMLLSVPYTAATNIFITRHDLIGNWLETGNIFSILDKPSAANTNRAIVAVQVEK